MKTTPKGIENLTDGERRVTRIDEAKEILEFPGYFITPARWVWDNKKEKFKKREGSKRKRIGVTFSRSNKTFYRNLDDLVKLYCL